MSSIHNHYKEIKTDKEIQELIKVAIKDIRFNEERGYFFIYQLDGVNVLHPTKPQREGKSFFNAQDINGVYIVQESINIAKSPTGEGFQSWYFNKPTDETKEYKKVGFIKKFEPYNWYVGTGDYLDDYKKSVKDKIVNHIALLKYIDNRSMFVIDFEGNLLVKENRRVTNAIKTDRLTTFKKFIASEEKHTFSEYQVQRDHDTVKISYITKIDRLDLVIGTGFYVGKVRRFIEKRIEKLNQESTHVLTNILLYSIFITTLVLLLTYFVARYLEKIFHDYNRDLSRKNRLLTRSQKQAKIGSWEQTDKNGTLRWSDEAYRIFEVNSHGSLSFNTFINRVHPDDRESVIKALNRSVATQTNYYLEHRLLFDDGRVKYVIEQAEHFYDRDKHHIKTVGTVQDITERKKIDSMLTSVFQVIPDLLFIMKRDGTIVDYRAQTEHDLYVKPEYFLGHKMQEVLPKNKSELFMKHFKNILNNHPLQIFEYQLEMGGTTKYFEARMAQLPADDYIMMIVRDITAHEKLSRKYETMQERGFFYMSWMEPLLMSTPMSKNFIIDPKRRLSDLILRFFIKKRI